MHSFFIFFLFSFSLYSGFFYDAEQKKLVCNSTASNDAEDNHQIRSFFLASLYGDEEKAPLSQSPQINEKTLSRIKGLFQNGRTALSTQELQPLIAVKKTPVQPGFCRKLIRGVITCVALLGGYFAVEYGLTLLDERLASWIASGTATLITGFSYALINSLVQPSTAKFAQWGYQAVGAAELSTELSLADSPIREEWQQQFLRTNQKTKWTEDAGRTVLFYAQIFIDTQLVQMNSAIQTLLLQRKNESLSNYITSFIVNLMYNFRLLFSLDVPFGPYAKSIQNNFNLYEEYLPLPEKKEGILQQIEEQETNLFDQEYYENLLASWFPFLQAAS